MSNTLLHWGESSFDYVGQQVDDEILVQMMVNDEISDSQGIENDSILAGVTFMYFLAYLLTLSIPFQPTPNSRMMMKNY